MYILIYGSDHCRRPAKTEMSARITAVSTICDDDHRSDRGRGTRHRLSVLADDVADAVAAAGGLIFDRVGVGWDVQVFLAERTDQCALRILGVDASELSDGIKPADEWPDAIVVAAELYAHEVRVRRYVGTASRQHCSEVTIWGGDWPATLDPGIGPVEHRLSIAAQAFKVHAMEAAGVTPRTTLSERFRSGKSRFTIAAPLVPS
jgi:hypothetical protein